MERFSNAGKRSYFFSLLSYVMLCATQLITGCATDDNDSFTPENTGYELVLGTRLLQTRATDTYFEPSDEIGLFAVNTVQTAPNPMLLPSGNHFNNERFTLRQDGSTWVADNKITFPTDNAPLDLYLYYPYRQTPFNTGTQIDFQVQTDQTLHSAYTRSDLATAFLDTVTRRPTVAVDFYHRLSRMQFQLKNGSGYPTLNALASAQIKILHVQTDVTYDLAQDTILSTGNLQNVVPFQPVAGWVNNGTVLLGAKAIVAPQTFSANAAIEVTVGNKVYVASLTGVTPLESGQSRVFTITIGNAGIEFDTELNPWDYDGENPLQSEELADKEFITKWDIQAGDNIMLPLDTAIWDIVSMTYLPCDYDMVVAWGDGSSDTIRGRITEMPVHHYIEGGLYEITISGTCPSFRMSRIDPGMYPNQKTPLRLIEVVNWGDVGFKSMMDAFYGCENLVSVPGRIPNVIFYGGLFSNCYSLNNVPEDLFEGCTMGQEFTALFRNTALQVIPGGLFNDCVNAENFSVTFENTQIQRVPANLFAGCPNAKHFASTFANCTNLTTLPSYLFANSIIIQDFYSVFANCIALEELPADLFAGSPTISSFYHTFSGCVSLKTIPASLFAGNPDVISFYGVFQDCSALTAIPVGLFDNNLKAFDFSYAFSGCTSLTGSTPNTQRIELWEREQHPDKFFSEYGGFHGGSCFENCTGLTNYYTTIPNNWK
ncbi:MAG: fimbrillin family protein [Culturomica sp.]|nr:fimbrillin family protein [Culturomica sp.]